MYKYFTELVDFVGSRPKPFDNTKKYISTGALKTNNISEDDIEMIDFATRPSRADLEVKNGDILFAKMAFTDKRLLVGEIEADYIYSTGFFAAKPKEGIITSKCLYFLLNSESFRNQKDINSTGATQRAITIEGLKKISLRIPEYHRQNQIGKTLENIDKIIKLKKQQLTEYDQLIKSRFVEMFGDLGLNTNKYRIVNLSDIAHYFNGLTYSPENVSNEGTIVLRSSNIQNSKLDFKDIVRVQSQVNDNKIVRENDILMCSRNGSARLVGKVALIDDFPERMAFGAFMMIIRSEYYSYLMIYFQMDAFRRQITTGATTTINQITSRMLNNVKLPLPNKSQIKEFESIVKQVDKLKFIVIQLKSLQKKRR